jgi:hypothetical protein
MAEFEEDPTIPLQAHHAAHDPGIVLKKQQFDWFILRYAEVGLMSEKGRVRMENQLRKHIHYHARNQNLGIKRLDVEFGRILVQLTQKSPQTTENFLAMVNNIFGIVSSSPVLRIEKNLSEIGKACASYTLKFLQSGQKVAVKVKGEQQSFRREEVAKVCHDAIMQNAPPDTSINLNDPDLRIYVELRQTGAFIYSAIIPTTWGGLPTDKEMGLIAMFTGNPTELVSAVKLLRRGANLFPIIFRSKDNASDRFYWNGVDKIFNLLPFSRVYGIEFNLDNIHRRIEKKLTRYREELENEWKKISPEISSDTMHQGLFCLLCWKLRFALINQILDRQKDIYASFLGSEADLLIESNLFLDDRWLDHPAGPKKTIFTPNLIYSPLMSKMELYRVRFKAFLSGIYPEMICPFDLCLLEFLQGSHYPSFHGAYVLNTENIQFEYAALTKANKEEFKATDARICSHPPTLLDQHTPLNRFLPIMTRCLQKLNVETLVENILPEGELHALKDEGTEL